MYSLFSRVPSTLVYLRDCMSSYIQQTGMYKLKDPVTFIQKILDIRVKFTRIIENAFLGDKMFEKTLKDAFEKFINKDQRPAKFLSLYIDSVLKRKLTDKREQSTTENQLERVIVIFRYLYDKDVFENFYKKDLSKRLLSGHSVSDDAERV
eukprot:GSMAST32.ASY1.ANO1.1515.1 assembled CDS